MTQKILILNCGSSSIKLAIIDPHTGHCFLSGLVEHFSDAQLILNIEGAHEQHHLATSTFELSLNATLALIQQYPAAQDITAIGHRVVHGGTFFSSSTVLSTDVIDKIQQCNPLAPLHNPVNLKGIHAITARYPSLPQVACFDTAFHQTLKSSAFLYPTPYSWYTDHHVRKYGFHGSSHQFVSQEAILRYRLDPQKNGMISLHLGNGCSLCAIQNSKSIDTTMGMTPLDGLMMGSRSGSVDPGILQYVHHASAQSIDDITTALNKESGLLGVSGLSNDLRDLHAAVKDGHKRAAIALTLFVTLAAKQTAAMMTQLNQLDCLIFTGGIGENDPEIRQAIIDKLSLFQIDVDPTKNQAAGQHDNGKINHTTPIVCVIPTNEEWQIAKETRSCLKEHL